MIPGTVHHRLQPATERRNQSQPSCQVVTAAISLTPTHSSGRLLPLLFVTPA